MSVGAKAFRELVDVYPVTDRSLFNGRTDEKVISELAAGGARIVQLRVKNLPDGEFFRLAKLYREQTRIRNMLLIINDRVDIAMLVEADGVHLGRSDLPIPEARRLLGKDAIIGGSSHSLEQAIEVQSQGATYVNIGPIFSTPTKPGVEGIGLGPLREVLAKANIPVTCMGGVEESNLGEVVKAGAKRIGVVRAVFGVDDISGAVSRMADIMRE